MAAGHYVGAAPQHRAPPQRQHHRRLQTGLPGGAQLPARLGHLQRALRLRRPALPVPARRHAADGAVRIPALLAVALFVHPDQHRGHPDCLVPAAADVQLHAVLGGRARPAAGHVLHRDRDQHAGVHQHQRLRPAGGDAVLAVAAGRQGQPSVVGRCRDRADAYAQTRARAAAVAAPAEPPVAGAGDRHRGSRGH